jgi:hypothetical protein
MHEAALAGRVAARLREAQRAGVVGRARLLVRGCRDEPTDFDAAVRLHLALAAPELDADALDIVHLQIDRLCAACGHRFGATEPAPACPSCGGVALPLPMEEEVEIDWTSEEAV